MTLTNDLIALKAQYESALETSGPRAFHYRELIVHVDALLLDQLPQPTNGSTPTATLKFATTVSKVPSTQTTTAKTKTPTSGKSFPMLPDYQGMTKIDAIAKVLTEQSNHVVHQDRIIQLLYGDLSLEELHLESRRMRASLFRGVDKGLWERAPKQPSSYILKSAKESTAAAKVSPSVKGSKSKTPVKGART
ncbi:MAG: hypothetical protein HC852_02850 [Acaryochloridaceae cyanobacterium RU_4_10]|nr:hypothetical protein [Acaryochloridaceae cyanobacterium RU_4_10]